MHEISIPYTVISSAARNLFRFPFPSSFAKPFRGSTVPVFPAIQCFPFLAVGHAPSYRQRKRSLDFARDDVAEVAFSQHILYTGRGLSIPPYRHFERSREIFLALCSFLLPSQKVSPFPLSHIRRYTGVQERSLGFARDDDTGKILSKHSLCRICWIRASPSTQKKPRQEPELFWCQKTYLPNCASMVPAATAVPITPATFGPIACISR